MFTVDEGYRDMAYLDTTGHVTVGIGFNMDSPNARETWADAGIHDNFDLVYNRTIPITLDEAWALLNTCIDNCKTDLLSILHDFDSYPENIKMALINLCFNLGLPKLTGFTTFLGRIRLGNYAGAALDLSMTLWAMQLPERAKRVCQLINGDDSFYLTN